METASYCTSLESTNAPYQSLDKQFQSLGLVFLKLKLFHVFLRKLSQQAKLIAFCFICLKQLFWSFHVENFFHSVVMTRVWLTFFLSGQSWVLLSGTWIKLYTNQSKVNKTKWNFRKMETNKWELEKRCMRCTAFAGLLFWTFQIKSWEL